MLDIVALDIPDVKLITPKRFEDPRGFFSETYNERRFRQEADIPHGFVQDNHSLSVPRHTLRGLHIQRPPYAQAKLIRVLRGSILDVAVDVRIGSPTYGRAVTTELSSRNWTQLYVPEGFLHGFVTLEADTEVLYKVSAFYNKDSEDGVIWNDPDIAVPWGVAPEDVLLSDKDQVLGLLKDFDSPFCFG